MLHEKLFINNIETYCLLDYFPIAHFSLERKMSKHKLSNFEDKTNRMILDFKNTGKYYEVFSELLGDYYISKKIYQNNQAILIPIPSSQRNKYEKRYKNFCESFSKKIGIKNGYGYIFIKNDCVEAKLGDRSRRDYTEELRLNVSSDQIKGKNIILFDDILTTGITARVIVDFLRKYGVKDIKIFTLGKTYNYSIRGKLEYQLEFYGKNLYESLSLEELIKKDDFLVIKPLMNLLTEASSYEIRVIAHYIKKLSRNYKEECNEVAIKLINALDDQFPKVRETILITLLELELSLEELKILEKKVASCEENYNLKIYNQIFSKYNYTPKEKIKFKTSIYRVTSGVKSLLIDGIFESNKIKIKEALENGESININFSVTNYKKITPLGLAILLNDDQILKYLIELGANIEGKIFPNIGKILTTTPLVEAVKNGNFKLIYSLLEAGVDPTTEIIVTKNEELSNGNLKLIGIYNGALNEAISQGDSKVVKLLLKYDLKIKEEISNRIKEKFEILKPEFYLALEYGDFGLITLLIEAGANFENYIPYAILSENKKLLSLILSNINKNKKEKKLAIEDFQLENLKLFKETESPLEIRRFVKNDTVQDFVIYSLKLKKTVSKEVFKEFLRVNSWWMDIATMPNQVKRNLVRGIFDESEIKDTQW